MDKDLRATLAGGMAGLALLNSVKWEAVPHGEAVKIAVAFLLIIAGYLMYGGKPKDV